MRFIYSQLYSPMCVRYSTFTMRCVPCVGMTHLHCFPTYTNSTAHHYRKPLRCLTYLDPHRIIYQYVLRHCALSHCCYGLQLKMTPYFHMHSSRTRHSAISSQVQLRIATTVIILKVIVVVMMLMIIVT